MTWMAEIVQRPRGAKIALAVDCIQRFIELADSMDTDSLRHLQQHLIELSKNGQGVDKHDKQFILSAVLLAKEAARVNAEKSDD